MIFNFVKQLGFIVFVFLGSRVFSAADSLALTLAKADSLFLKNNLSLIAAKYNIDAQKAMVIQAKLYPNPNLSFEQSLVNSFTRKNYDTDPTRQGSTETVVQLQQLILLAGKRNKQIMLAKLDQQMAEYQFYDVLRTLKLQLHTDMMLLIANRRTVANYGNQQERISKMVEQMQLQYDKGFISLNELVRVKSLLFDISNQLLTLNNEYEDIQSELKMMLNVPAGTALKIITDRSLAVNIPTLNLKDMIDSAYAYRSDLKYAQASSDYSSRYFSYQKSQAVPDLTIGGVYDKSGSYIRNYFGLTLSANLPVWNRNQGNIQAARVQVEASKALLQKTTNELENDVAAAYNKLILSKNTYQSISPDYVTQISGLMDGILKNYQSKTINLVEFLSYYDSYKMALINVNQLYANTIIAIETLNFNIGKTIINY